MITNLFSMDGYGFFVWSAFIFTFVFCLFLYIRVKKDLLKHEKKFINKLKFMPSEKLKILKRKKIVKAILEKKLSLN